MPFITPNEGRKLPDSDRYRNRFEIESDSSDKKYIIAFDMARNAGYWTCSCRGCVTHGKCKHLTRFGYLGRQAGASHPENKAWIKSLTNGDPAAPYNRGWTDPMGTTMNAPAPVPEEVVPIWTAEDVAEAALEFETN